MKKIKIILVFLIFFISNIKAYNEAPIDITTMDVYEIQEAIDKGYLTYELLIKLYLDRIDAYDVKYKAIITINEKAIEEAKNCDIEFKKNGRSNILWCMPIIVKDNIDVNGMPTTVGSKALSDSYPNEDATVIKKLKEKGMIVIAKSNMSEFAFSSSSSVSYYGTVHNAYNLDYSSYGSSGGSAVAVAVRYAPFALGTDTNSSLRAPAAANNVIGFRPTLNLIETKGIFAYDITRDAVGPITKTVKENILLMNAMSSKDYNIPEDNSLSGKNIVVLDQFMPSSTYNEIKTMFNNSVKKLEEAGANIIHLNNVYSSDYEYIGNSTMGGWTMCYAFNKYIKNTSSKIKTFYDLASANTNTYSLWENYNRCNVSISYIDTIETQKSNFRKTINNVITKYNVDAFIYPTHTGKVLRIGESNSGGNSYKIAPVLGLPAVSVPLGFDSSGVAYGIEFMGAKNSENKLYEIIYEYEKLNHNYKLPDIAPALYTIPDSVNNLKGLYEALLNNKGYILNYLVLKGQKEEIKEYFQNYNDFENKSEEAGNIYKNTIGALKSVGYIYDEETKTLNKSIFLIMIKVLLYLTVIYLLYRVLNLSKKKKKSIKH